MDEVQLFMVPVAVGGGTPAFPLRHFVSLDLRETRNFDNTVFLRYAVNRTAK
ncbi:hypothetical protein AKJ09_04990 [Labilithrix luteola]|uniref:Bacterial bifunctional deaminase-reductase C-terminal domain-containing protein n=1 Tax=Labilithrix luteola TaxID=1391654 RepID=A0A0K1PY75_9BACT|nr:hypothetical protein [Labilithrix luteola]AKU98326.1 hypothetical protein AKJ09_04990 [Labilithrix luteola]